MEINNEYKILGEDSLVTLSGRSVGSCGGSKRQLSTGFGARGASSESCPGTRLLLVVFIF